MAGTLSNYYRVIYVSGGRPILEPSEIVSYVYRPFTRNLEPVRSPRRAGEPPYDNGSDLGAWYTAPTVNLFSAAAQPMRPPARGVFIAPTNTAQALTSIQVFIGWQQPLQPQLPPRRKPADAPTAIPFPPISLIPPRSPSELPLRLRARWPWPHINAPLFSETFIITPDKWRSQPPPAVRPPLRLTQGGNFAPPIVPTFDIIAWWMPPTVPHRLPKRITPTSFYNWGLPLPGDPLTVSQVDWFKPRVVYPAPRGPQTQSTQPNFQAYALTVAGFGSPLQPIRPRPAVQLSGSNLPAIVPTLADLRWISQAPQPTRPGPVRPHIPPAFRQIVVALDFPQLMQQPILRPRPALILPTLFAPPAVSDATQPRFALMEQPRARLRGPSVDIIRGLEPSLFILPPALSWAQQPVLPIRPPIRGAWPQPAMVIFRPALATTGHVAAATVSG